MSANSDYVAPESFQRQMKTLWTGSDLSSALSQHELDAIYEAEYGEPTEDDCNDWIMLFVGLHQDMKKLQEELLMTILAGADPKAMSAYFFGRFSSVMKERVAVLGRGEPIVIEGYPPRALGHMMSQWAAEAASAAPSFYERIEAVLAAQAKPRGTGTWEATLPMGTPKPSQEAAHEPVQPTKDPRKRGRTDRARRRYPSNDGKEGSIAEKGAVAKNRHSISKEGRRY